MMKQGTKKNSLFTLQQKHHPCMPSAPCLPFGPQAGRLAYKQASQLEGQKKGWQTPFLVTPPLRGATPNAQAIACRLILS